ncbi:MAG: hypothetical protein M1819_000045 [Sarea resinae]|nr:MAG: hypothetical protein M1819_000045 [Sarea resinae]
MLVERHALRCFTGQLRRYATATATAPRFQPVEELADSSLESFRQRAFSPALPVVLARGHFSQFPALKRWFLPQGNAYCLNDDYLNAHGTTMVPLELTRPGSSEDTFARLDAPLSLFLDWTRQAGPETVDRLYLAQAQVTSLPKQLRDDLPVPSLVASAGKGDIYDTNLWIGLAPTYTSLHRDPNPNLFVQLAGKKTVRLYTPEDGARIFQRIQAKLGRGGSAAFRGEEMMHGEEKVFLEKEVWGDGAGEEVGQEAQLERGDSLFIPKGWWHSIKGVGNGVIGSVNWWFR